MNTRKSPKLLWLSGQVASSPHTKITGYLGELIVLEYMRNTDWFCWQPRRRKVGDIAATNAVTGNILKIEVKIAKRGKSGRYNFCLRKDDKHGVTDCGHSDVVLLICVDAAGGFHCYVIPAHSIPAGQQRLTISSHPAFYSGKYADYRQRWADVPGSLLDAVRPDAGSFLQTG